MQVWICREHRDQPSVEVAAPPAIPEAVVVRVVVVIVAVVHW